MLKLFGHNAFVYVQLLGGTSKSGYGAHPCDRRLRQRGVFVRQFGEKSFDGNGIALSGPSGGDSVKRGTRKKAPDFSEAFSWSGKRDSNSRPRPWQGRALPTELFPHTIGIFAAARESKRVSFRSPCERFPRWDCKGTNFFYTPKYFFHFFHHRPGEM